MIDNKSQKSLIQKSFFVFLIRVFSTISGFGFVYLITESYGAEGLGIFALCQSITMILVLASLLGTDLASIKFVSQYLVNNDIPKIKSVYLTIVKIVIPLSIFISIMLLISKGLLSESIFNKPDLQYGLDYIVLCILPMCFISIHSESLRGIKEVELYSIVKYLLVPIFSIIIMFMLSEDNSVYVPVKSYSISILFVSLIGFLLWIKKSKFLYYDKAPSTSIKKILNFSFPLMLSSSMFLLLQWIDILILGYYESSKQIGIYNVSVKLSMVCSIILFSINSIAAPKFSQLFTENKFDELKDIIKNTSKFMFITTIPILAIVIIFSEYILNFLGGDFIQGKTCIVYLVIGQLFNVIFGSVGYILNMTENQSIFKNIMIIATVLNIILNILLIPIYGILGAAISSMISLIIWNLIASIYIYRKYKISTVWFIK